MFLFEEPLISLFSYHLWNQSCELDLTEPTWWREFSLINKGSEGQLSHMEQSLKKL